MSFPIRPNQAKKSRETTYICRLRLSESDSEVVVKEFIRKDLRPKHAVKNPVRIAKRLNIPIRIPPIETDLQALIKPVDDTQEIIGTESNDAVHRTETAPNNYVQPLEVGSGDEKDVVIKLYNTESVPTQRRRSSSLGSVEGIRNVRIHF